MSKAKELFARTRQAGDHHQLILRDIDIDSLEVVSSRTPRTRIKSDIKNCYCTSQTGRREEWGEGRLWPKRVTAPLAVKPKKPRGALGGIKAAESIISDICIEGHHLRQHVSVSWLLSQNLHILARAKGSSSQRLASVLGLAKS